MRRDARFPLDSGQGPGRFAGCGIILNHFGITPDELIRYSGMTRERLQELARQGIDWALPNVMLGALVIVPVWFLIYLFRPPGPSRE
jgi:Family of unknown function (DUF6460)